MKFKFNAIGLALLIIAILHSFGTPGTYSYYTIEEFGKCSDQLPSLATCLVYWSVENHNAIPTDCCISMKHLLLQFPQCFCLWVQERHIYGGDGINATLTLAFPSRCNILFDPASNCLPLLHLEPNSTEAQVFEDYANKDLNATARVAAPANSSSCERRPNADEKSDGGKLRNSFLGIEEEAASGIFLSTLALLLAHNMF